MLATFQLITLYFISNMHVLDNIYYECIAL